MTIDLSKPVVDEKGNDMTVETSSGLGSASFYAYPSDKGYLAGIYYDSNGKGLPPFQFRYIRNKSEPLDWSKPIEFVDGSPTYFRGSLQKDGKILYRVTHKPSVDVDNDNCNYYLEDGTHFGNSFLAVRNVKEPEMSEKEMAEEYSRLIREAHKLRKKLEDNGWSLRYRLEADENNPAGQFGKAAKLGPRWTEYQFFKSIPAKEEVL